MPDPKQLPDLRQLLHITPTDVDCERCLAQLDAYIDAQLAGADYLTLYPEVATHLDLCERCADAYARLYELAWAEANGTLLAATIAVPPDLSFLSPMVGDSWRQRLRTAFSQGGEQLRLQLNAALLPDLRPAYATSTLRAAGDARFGELILALEETDEEGTGEQWPLTFAIYRDAENPELARVEVTAAPEGRQWPDLGELTVTLTVDNVEYQGQTDAWGFTAFEGIPIAALDGLVIAIAVPPS